MQLGFVEAYVTQSYFKTDPWLEYATASSNPWHLDVGESSSADNASKLRSLSRLFSDFGYKDVLLVPVVSQGIKAAAVLYFSTPRNPCSALDDTFTRELITATRVFATMNSHDDAGIPNQYDLGPRLSLRETEALRWLAQGYRVDRISDQMGVRNVTVHKYFETVRDKLGTRTRDESLAKAVSLGLVKL